MTTPFFAWWRMWTEAAQTSVRLWETIAASAVVIDRRMPMIDAGLRNPWTADHAELTGMVTEKVQAFTLAGQSLAHDMHAMQALWARVMLDALSAGTTRTPPTARRMTANTGRAMRLAESTLGAGGRALKPIHATATANATRLSRRP